MNVPIVLLGGILAVVLLDSIGSIASRKLNFNYGLLSPLSMLIFGMVGALAAQASSLYIGIGIATIVGLVDATVGWKISVLLNANMGSLEEDDLKFDITTVVFTVLFAVVCGFVGAYFWG